jgi:hypothetical protein
MIINRVFHLVEQFVFEASSLDKTFAIRWSPAKTSMLEQIYDVRMTLIALILTVFRFAGGLLAKVGLIEVKFCGAERQCNDGEIEPERFRPGTSRHNARR